MGILALSWAPCRTSTKAVPYFSSLNAEVMGMATLLLLNFISVTQHSTLE